MTAAGELRFSIVTPSFNRADMLARALESVGRQKGVNLEHIVVDGGSDDGTLALLADYPHLRVVSEPDEGIYDAMNKGIAMADGDIVTLLNSDDWFEPGSLAAVAAAFAAAPEAQIVSGKARFLRDLGDGREAEVRFHALQDETAMTPLNLAYASKINARFFRRRVFEDFGPFDYHRYPLTADLDFLMRVALAGVPQVGLDRYLYCYLAHAGSATIHGDLRRGLTTLYENLDLSEALLADPDLDPAGAADLQRWHSDVSAKAAGIELRYGAFSRSMTAAKRGLSRSQTWPFAFFRALLGGAGRRGLRRLRGA
ncbi:MAG TPA: glycosyltransferase family 2 protein [Kiloniellaceae bacterium]|nr:glycosyltransferase family 2 protein [Kiloniellaceae bacterium]